MDCGHGSERSERRVQDLRCRLSYRQQLRLLASGDEYPDHDTIHAMAFNESGEHGVRGNCQRDTARSIRNQYLLRHQSSCRSSDVQGNPAHESSVVFARLQAGEANGVRFITSKPTCSRAARQGERTTAGAAAGGRRKCVSCNPDEGPTLMNRHHCGQPSCIRSRKNPLSFQNPASR